MFTSPYDLNTYWEHAIPNSVGSPNSWRTIPKESIDLRNKQPIRIEVTPKKFCRELYGKEGGRLLKIEMKMGCNFDPKVFQSPNNQLVDFMNTYNTSFSIAMAGNNSNKEDDDLLHLVYFMAILSSLTFLVKAFH